ncbi:MAG TPA: phosphoribosylformylglycinamidine synthase I [Planctomycetota bacterium]|nr:phosphoribosylformylglycinamidine synthase I [Planctomycetota bacterium]
MTRALVLRSAGTNCDEETAHAFELAGAEVERLHVGVFLRGERRLDEFDVLAFPGGFSYGDDLGAGTVLANRLRARLADDLAAFVASGRLVIGICNGFQVLVRLGLLPGWEGEKAVSLIENGSGKFEDRWVTLRVDSPACPFLARVEGARMGGEGWTLRLPVAHREGRFFARDPEVLARLEEGGQVALRYIEPGSAAGSFAEAHPANPSGSIRGIAGITNPAGNVLGLMPHPERHVRALHDPGWTRRAVLHGLPENEERAGDGFVFFRNAVEYSRAASTSGEAQKS